LKLGPRIKQQKRDKAATIVQKYMRGYLESKKALKRIAVMRVENASEFFRKIRQKVEEDAQVKIAYWYRKRVKELRKRKEREEKSAGDGKKKAGV
jgi:hypothetical protein